MSGPSTVPSMFKKFRYLLSFPTASTTIFPLSPTIFVCTSKSDDIGGRETPRTNCAQNFEYKVDPSHCEAQIALASLVNTADRPSPVCQCAMIGSCILPAAIGITTFGSLFRVVSTIPNTSGNPLNPLTNSADGST